MTRVAGSRHCSGGLQLNPRRARVIAAGDCDSGSLYDIATTDLLVCVDGGLGHALGAGLKPDWLVGDLDSVSEPSLAAIEGWSVQRFRFPPSKNASDLQLALELLAEAGVSEVFLYGVSGGRTDHALFNWMLPLQRHWPFVMHCMDRSVQATVVRPDQPFACRVSSPVTFSLLPLCVATGVTVAEVKYPLENATLTPGDTLGLSNECESGELRVSLVSGLAWVLINRKPEEQPG